MLRTHAACNSDDKDMTDHMHARAVLYTAHSGHCDHLSVGTGYSCDDVVYNSHVVSCHSFM